MEWVAEAETTAADRVADRTMLMKEDRLNNFSVR